MATVLVVTMSRNCRRTRNLLTDEGYRVLTACNGKQGLVRLAEQKPDVVLLDCMMPILGGDGMLHAMAAVPGYQRIPVIMMSSLGEDVIAKDVGLRRFLHKPFRVAAVLSTVAASSAEWQTTQP